MSEARYYAISYSAVKGVLYPIYLGPRTLTEAIRDVGKNYDILKAEALATKGRIPCLMIIDADALDDIERDGASRHRQSIHYQAGIY